MKFALKIEPTKIKSLIPELILLMVLCSIAYYFSETPEIKPYTKKPDTKAETTAEVKRHNVRFDKIMERNLFSVDGKYESVLTPPSENPYTLIAILIGQEKRAVFRDYQGKTFTAKPKEILIDGYTVEEIKENSVILKRGKNKKELTIFKPQRGT